MSVNGAAVIRVILQRVDEGDKRKARAESNDAASGGGARDLRFNPQDEFLPFLGKVFTGRRTKRQKTVYFGDINWNDGVSDRSAELEVWPPYPSRPFECKIGRVSSLHINNLIKQDPNGGHSVIVIFQRADGEVWLYFTTETSLLSPNIWDPKIEKLARFWFNDGCKSAFLDLVTNEQYPHV